MHVSTEIFGDRKMIGGVGTYLFGVKERQQAIESMQKEGNQRDM